MKTINIIVRVTVVLISTTLLWPYSVFSLIPSMGKDASSFLMLDKIILKEAENKTDGKASVDENYAKTNVKQKAKQNLKSNTKENILPEKLQEDIKNIEIPLETIQNSENQDAEQLAEPLSSTSLHYLFPIGWEISDPISTISMSYLFPIVWDFEEPISTLSMNYFFPVCGEEVIDPISSMTISYLFPIGTEINDPILAKTTSFLFPFTQEVSEKMERGVDKTNQKNKEAVTNALAFYLTNLNEVPKLAKSALHSNTESKDNEIKELNLSLEGDAKD